MHTRLRISILPVQGVSRWNQSLRRAACLVLIFAAAAAQLPAAEIAASLHMVPMRDGTLLATTVYRATGVDEPQPVIFSRGPYGRGVLRIIMAEQACPRGYVVVTQDMRGRHDSEGSDAVVFHNDGWSDRRDGQDSLDWIMQQPWCDGNVATWGASALGVTQVLLAPGASRGLKAQYVQVAFSDMYSQAAFQGGAWRKALVETWLKSQKFDALSLETFLAHPRYDSFWDQLNADRQAHRVHAPAIFWGGWYDIFLQGTINSFVTVHQYGAPPARGNCRLIIGPYAHGTFDELKYPDNSLHPPDQVNDPLRFFDKWLRGVDEGVSDQKAVYYYVMGDPTTPGAPGNIWRSADQWPPPARLTNFYLHADGELSTAAAGSDKGSLTFRFDPGDPVPTIGGQNLSLPKGPMDQRRVEARDDALVFTSDVLAEPLEVTGRVIARLFVASDCPDTDFTVKLCDVYPDGRSMLVTDGILRARYRNGFTREDLLEPEHVYDIDVDLWSTSLVFNAGHRIRVAVSSSNAPRFEPNPNTGRPFRFGEESRIATNTLHLSRQYPSRLILPVYSEARRRDGESSQP